MYLAIAFGLGALLLLVLGLAPVVNLVARSARVDLFTNGGSADPLTVIGTTAVATGMTAMGNMAGVEIGSTITGPGIPAATTVVAMDNAAHTLTLSQAATAIHAGSSYVFTPPGGDLITQGANFNLFMTDMNPGTNMVLSDYTAAKATFDGYATKTLSMTLGYIDATQTPYAQSQLLSFVKTAGATSNLIYGWWIDDGTDVIMAAKFNAPIAMSATGAEISGVLADGYPAGPTWQPLIPSNA